MGKKRRRPRKSGPAVSSQSITAGPGRFSCPKGPVARTDHPTHPVISLYYRELWTLRQYLLHQLPSSSKLRRRRIASLGVHKTTESRDEPLVALLDSTLVGVLKQSSPKDDSARRQDYIAFRESQSHSILASTDTGATSPQSEVVDFVIQRLFAKHDPHQWPQHMLMHGFQRPSMGANALDSGIPGIVIQFPNQNVTTLKQSPWADVLGLLGENGDDIMMRLLLDCGVYAPIDAPRGIFYQLSGQPLSALEFLGSTSAAPLYSNPRPKPDQTGYVLNRMSSLDSATENVHVMKYIFPRQFGLQNVFSESCDAGFQFQSEKAHDEEIRKIANLEREKRARLAQAKGIKWSEKECSKIDLKLPKRLRGQALELTQKLRTNHSRCAYATLLEYYCPDPSGPWKLAAPSSTARCRGDEPVSTAEENLVTQVQEKSPSSLIYKPDVQNDSASCNMGNSGVPEVKANGQTRIPKPKPSLTDHATPASSVSAFCRAVIQRLVPLKFFGQGAEGVSNRKLILKHVDSFIKLRRFENLSLHEVCKALKISGISWLACPQLQASHPGEKMNMSLSDFQKRKELMHELIYYIFDSIVIPLVRNNFYVTESQTHRNRLFYFRHDVWVQLTEQSFAELKANMFEEIEPIRAESMLAGQSLGLGSLRLLPKSTGLRPILNLRKRTRKEGWRNGKKNVYQAPSVNTRIGPIYDMFKYEQIEEPYKVGSSLYSIGDMHPRLRDFRKQLTSSNRPLGTKANKPPPLYFVKLDIQACFDTIPQERLLRVIDKLLSEETYHITKHVEVTPGFNSHGRASRKYVGRAAPAKKQQVIKEIMTKRNELRRANTVFVDTVGQRTHGAAEMLDLLEKHIQNNLLKMGKTYYRQRKGIPQGSVLSSLLCNFFYAELERKVLGFLNPASSLLLRLVDDFLLITTDVGQGTHFLETMLRGQPSYGVAVNPAKSMVNFTAVVDGIHIPRLEGTPLFPYCGCLIDTHTLAIHRDQERLLEGGHSAAAMLSNTLTVETTRSPGCVMHRKVIASFRLQLHSMYLDGAHNSRAVVLHNLFTSLITTAMKMYRYMKALRGHAQPGPPMIIRTIRDLMSQTAGTIRTRRSSHAAPLSCSVQLWHIQYLTAAAFRFVFLRKQTRYALVLRWLDSLEKQSRPVTNAEAARITRVVKRGKALFDGWRF
ncbi:Telomere reverse transcriptase [Penicillium capsulatum]|nr:Telomere reverse transcriptase [Penicillium capsulatum]